MSILSTPPVAAVLARLMQGAVAVSAVAVTHRGRTVFPELAANRSGVTIPTARGPVRVVVYLPARRDPRPPVHVNFHGGGYIMRGVGFDDPLCRFLAAEAGVVVVNVDYAVAPQHQFPVPPHQAFEVVQWVAEHGAEHDWDGGRLTVGGQSAGGGLAASVARQALEHGGPPIALQVLHYPVLDIATSAADKPTPIAKPMIRPWMGEIFDSAYVPDRAARTDRLVSPAGAADTADLTGIAPALVVTAEFDRLRTGGQRYADRLGKVGALVEYHEVPQADHAYDMKSVEKARETYDLIARCVTKATYPSSPLGAGRAGGVGAQDVDGRGPG